ncbi:MAG TPA: hypothetical protein ENL46_07610 [Candidatus Aminicenantes bacterium]|nr:hypothetical protein [Candidatus Aminicenantes bacterium]
MRRFYCNRCGKIRYENISCADPKKHYTHTLEEYVMDLCAYMTIRDVAEHRGLPLVYDPFHILADYSRTLNEIRVDEANRLEGTPEGEVIKRRAYGYRDLVYFKLKIYNLHATRYSLL